MITTTLFATPVESVVSVAIVCPKISAPVESSVDAVIVTPVCAI